MPRVLRSPCLNCVRYNIPHCIDSCQTLKFVQNALLVVRIELSAVDQSSTTCEGGFSSDDNEIG
jgi:hypothetical protein